MCIRDSFITGGIGDIKVWDFSTKELVHTFEAHERLITGLALTSDNKYLASVADDNKLKLWDISSKEAVKVERRDHKGNIYSVLISEDNRYLITTSADQTVKLWNLDIQEQQRNNNFLDLVMA
eukprot:TRINITY_DN411_c0_g1_i4.p3 TRINITY_DN411_c0_g1~~TRINITY_DN411_c0_g1_i4.p3  ORF type:complete len:123 (-),score=18.36 TRINITY_DN411_c0_g1_i4:165-533(-)